MIRTIASGILFMALLPAMLACGKLPDPVVSDTPREEQNGGTDSTMPETIKISISGRTLPLKIEDNVATKALVEALRKASITYEADDYGGFEKVGALGRSLPSADRQISTSSGDVVLYNSRNMVIFYGSNTWSYTLLGKIQYGTTWKVSSALRYQI